MKKLLFLFAFMPLLMASTCNNDDDTIMCTQEFVYGLQVSVHDAVTGLPMAEGVQVKAVDGTYHENLYNLIGQDSTFYGAGERVGIYTITVTKEGYQTYTSSPIGVSANQCHVNPQSLTVNLQPE
ncbi:MAG TPA: carboxypeptidase-like regulatory domain-containing protein [Flavobacterium sp.]|uniref:carboxypeptidase-like regulatory domain-containing protein n=1 Tax=Flavobacterium sp. TaxID=239 RepID=UPI002CCBA1CF|nr:carboxypeptidase-like regulatory domain-containing protein [Flavobacterium sp.]HNP32370.1 carboxypeptidase-like regulatory domain-containing protein [Flavobacterium sp.]